VTAITLCRRFVLLAGQTAAPPQSSDKIPDVPARVTPGKPKTTTNQ
jgi:hypothetical protein